MEKEMDRFSIRVWDNYRECYLGEIEKTVVAEDGTEWTFPAWIIPNGGIITVTGINRNPERFAREQYTGIKDCTGKPVFVGDTIRVAIPADKANWYKAKEGIFEITEELDGFDVFSLDFNPVSGYSCITHIIDFGFEVIGNVHEVTR